MVNERVRRTFALSKQDIYFMIVILMLALVMYWTGIVVQPTLDIAETQEEQLDLATEQQKEIIDNQNNNTEKLQQSFDTQQVILAEVENQSNTISEAVDYFSDNINQTYFQLENTERMRSMQILNNLTSMRNELNGTLDRLEATGLTEEEKTVVKNLLLDIRKELGRLEVESVANPVQRQTSIQPPSQQQGGQISSLDGGPEPIIINQTFSTPYLTTKDNSTN